MQKRIREHVSSVFRHPSQLLRDSRSFSYAITNFTLKKKKRDERAANIREQNVSFMFQHQKTFDLTPIKVAAASWAPASMFSRILSDMRRAKANTGMSG